MDSLVGRTKELTYLTNIYAKVPISCAVCGRRHLGKTAILKEFCKDKPHIYISGMTGLSKDNLKEMAKELTAFSGAPTDLADVADFFPTLKKVCGKKKVIIIIDNYSELVNNFPEFTSYMRSFINRDLPNTKIMLIVCDTDSSVFGRFYYTLDVRSMTYRECVGFHPEYTPLQHFIAYSVVGGTPAYQKLFQGDPSEVIKKQFFTHLGVFLLEAESMMGSEPNARLNGIKVLAAIASGAETVADIADVAEIRSSAARDALEDLVNKGMVRKEVSQSKKSVYVIHSNILRFYYSIVDRYFHQVSFRSSDEAYEMAKADIDRYLEGLFEYICVDYITYAYKCGGIGKPRRKDNSSDDVMKFVAVIEDKMVQRTAVATCRLYGDRFGKGDLETLKERAKAVKGGNRMYFMFSATGFSVDLQKIASKDSDVHLISLEDIYR